MLAPAYVSTAGLLESGLPARQSLRSAPDTSSLCDVARSSRARRVGGIAGLAGFAIARRATTRTRSSMSARGGDTDTSDVAALEEQLRCAVEAEDYAEAARLRDELQFKSLDAEAAILSANREFYESFREGSVARMVGIWLESPRSCCVHPARPPLHGFDAVADSWKIILTQGGAMDIECLKPSVAMCGNTGRVVCYERVEGGMILLAVNLFERTP
ncbi:SKIP8, partial [Symbiodinium microadriaticum]